MAAIENSTFSSQTLAERLRLSHESVKGIVPDGTSVSLEQGELDTLAATPQEKRLEALKASLARQRVAGEMATTNNAGRDATVARARYGMESLKREATVAA